MALGPTNVLRVALYRLSLRYPASAIRRLTAAVPSGPFFAATMTEEAPAPASTDWDDTANYFGRHRVILGSEMPDWFANPLNGARVVNPDRPWWTIEDFNGELGDIKAVWEASRLDWAPILMQRARTGDTASLDRLEAWLTDWIAVNKPYSGPNWKCGQEASFRVMHLALSALLAGGPKSVGPGLPPLVKLHLQRIAPTTSYARAQDNNHGTSEAAALYIGGSWLEVLGDAGGARWRETGKRMLEERVQTLVETDGAFSQYSTNYHRLMLDTLSLAEVWRRELSLPEFSRGLREKAVAASFWLRTVVSPENGDAANIGANDGARLFPLGTTEYRDFRPSVQLAHALFAGTVAYSGDDSWNDYAKWLGVDLPETLAQPTNSRLFDRGGYGVLVAGKATAILRYPRFRFRPSHADALHLDLWVKGSNLLRDGGTFTYNAPDEVMDRFSGTSGHNTIQFDDRNQMPRIGRFLFADWLEAEDVALDVDAGTMMAAYRDGFGARHARRLEMTEDRLKVSDEVSGTFTSACLRWRLAPGDWELTPTGVRSAHASLLISSDMPLRMQVVNGAESRHYLDQTTIPVLEARFERSGNIVTQVNWAP